MKGGVKQWLNFGRDTAKESGVTLPSGDAQAADPASTQVLLVRSYLGRHPPASTVPPASAALSGPGAGRPVRPARGQ